MSRTERGREERSREPASKNGTEGENGKEEERNERIQQGKTKKSCDCVSNKESGQGRKANPSGQVRDYLPAK